MYPNNPREVDLPISQVEVEQGLVMPLESTPIPTTIKLKVVRHLKEVKPLDKKIIDRITLSLPTGETLWTSMKRLIEMKLKFLKPDLEVDLEHLPNFLMSFNRVILLLPNRVADDLPDRRGIRYTIKYLPKTIEN